MRTKVSKAQSTTAGLVLALGLLAPTAVLAHEGHHHEAMGTVKTIHEEHLVVTTTEGQERTFVLSESTKFVRGKAPSTRADLAAGERAVVMYETKDGADHAIEVKLGPKRG